MVKFVPIESHRKPKRKFFKHPFWMLFGTILMAVGSSMSVYAHEIPLNHVITDGIAYFLHGVGASPFVVQLEELFL